ncbi:MAG: HD domain-containing protein [Bacillota bacterium]|nr:HD domain-containing protein [Bacillota bacterium]
MLAAKCPGQDRRNWKPEDIFEHDCPHCGAVIEFWKTDTKTKCPKCEKPVFNPKFNLGCALWCSFADQCVGDISGVYTERPEVLRDKLEIEIRRYFIGERERLKITMEASELAAQLLEIEKEAEPAVVIAAVLLHDVGYTLCKKEVDDDRNINNCIQEKNIEIAAGIVRDLKLPRPVQEKVIEILSDGEGKNDLNRQLLEDIFELARYKKNTVDRTPSEDKKNELLSRLKRESSRKYALKIS